MQKVPLRRYRNSLPAIQEEPDLSGSERSEPNFRERFLPDQYKMPDWFSSAVEDLKSSTSFQNMSAVVQLGNFEVALQGLSVKATLPAVPVWGGKNATGTCPLDNVLAMICIRLDHDREWLKNIDTDHPFENAWRTGIGMIKNESIIQGKQFILDECYRANVDKSNPIDLTETEFECFLKHLGAAHVFTVRSQLGCDGDCDMFEGYTIQTHSIRHTIKVSHPRDRALTKTTGGS
ncbi:hypothetical protein QR680_003795 [Steinernema hermaphroditum]|uniref:Uncharacterized protein n=1 Tax=Steinernema hermaphroditum TaxID=289476 RepID=A0AA39HLL0_9BILA|nr:hypothetical protein QR680_003795 [Steinernema hermaphroditum]